MSTYRRSMLLMCLGMFALAFYVASQLPEIVLLELV